MTLKALREARAAKVAEARALVETAQRENRQLTTEESATFDTIKAAITDLEQQEQRQQFLDDAEIGSAHQQVGRETVPKLVRVDVLQPCDLGVFPHDLPDRDSLQWPSAE